MKLVLLLKVRIAVEKIVILMTRLQTYLIEKYAREWLKTENNMSGY